MTESQALSSLSSFLKRFTKGCIVATHNLSFDGSRLIRAIKRNDLVNDFQIIDGFSDTLTAFRKKFPARMGPGALNLANLCRELLEDVRIDDQSPHNSAYDVGSLHMLAMRADIEKDLICSVKKFKDYLQQVERKVEINCNLPSVIDLAKVKISRGILHKLSQHGISCRILKDTFREQGRGGIIELLSRPGNDNKPLITKNKMVLAKVLQYLSEQT